MKTSSTASNHPRLWISASELPALREKARIGTPKLIFERAKQIAETESSSFKKVESIRDGELQVELESLKEHIYSNAICFLMSGEEGYAKTAAEETLDLITREMPSDLQRASQAFPVVMAYDFCHAAWDQKARDAVGKWLVGASLRLNDVTSGNPDSPFNNWWGVTHSAAGLCAMAVQGDYTGAEKHLESCRERIRTYLCNYGERGHYYEGTGYGAYAMSFWAPFVLACKHADGVDIADLSHGLAYIAEMTYAMTVIRPKIIDDLKPESDLTQSAPETRKVSRELGQRISWNDDGGGFGGGSDVGCMFALAPRAQWPALRWMYDRLCGELGDHTFARGYGGHFFGLLYYPSQAEPREPEGILPLFTVDHRTGMAVFRNRYRDKDDCVLGAYAKAYHGGGHNHDDAGSFRFTGLDVSWSKGGGQAKSQKVFQSVLVREPETSVPQHAPKWGKLLYLAPGEGGSGSVSMRLNQIYHVPMADRHLAVDYSRASGAEALLAVVDVIMDDESADWSWTLCYEEGLEARLEPEHNGFTLLSPWSGASLTARFASPAGLAFSEHQGKPSQRTYSKGGPPSHYRGGRYVKATHVGEGTEFTFFCVMTLQKGEAPPMQIRCDNGDYRVKVGKAEVFLDKIHWHLGPARIVRVD